MQDWPGLIEAYRDWLPVSAKTPVITLHEGATPLIPVPTIAERIGKGVRVFVKYDGLNPTGSFKDRGMTMAMSKACEKGAQVVACASTGNTSAAAAAYAAKAKIKCVVILPHGNIAMGKLSQALIYGAETIAINGNFDDALRIVRELGDSGRVEVVNSINPVRIEGQKTAAFEICDQLGQSPDFHFLPVGNAGNITAYWKGFREYFDHKKIDRKPKMCGYQAAGAAPLVDGKPVANPDTVATAIRIGNPASWDAAIKAANESGGHIDKVEDAEILHAYKMIAQSDGIFAEPASAAPLAGLIKAVKDNLIPEGSIVTATMTGHGLKDPDRALSTAGKEPTLVEPDTASVLKAIGM